MQTSDAPLKFLGPQWFAVVMGWGGLSLAWLRVKGLIDPAIAGAVAAGSATIAVVVYLLILLLSLIRAIRYREALLEDLSHPVRHAFVGAFPVSTIVICASLGALLPGQDWIRLLFVLAAAFQLAVTVWVVSGWFRSGFRWPAATPVLMIPIVGNVLVPIAGIPLGFEKLSWAYLGLGMLMWPVVLMLILARTAVLPMPDRLLPSWFITIAPPAVSGVALAVAGAPTWTVNVMAGMAAFFVLCAFTVAARMRKLEFGMPFWAMSFPSAAFSAIISTLAQETPEATWGAQVLVWVVTGLILWLSAMTLRGLFTGSLLVAEPAPASLLKDGAGSPAARS